MEKIISEERLINASAADIWPIISDTAELNRRAGLPPMNFETINGIRHGRQKVMGIGLRWTEAPWEWSLNKWLRNERVYSRGFFKKITGEFTLIQKSPDSCLVKVSFSVTHRFPLVGAILEKATRKVIIDLLDDVSKITVDEKKLNDSVRFTSFGDWLLKAPGIERARMAPKLIARETGVSWQNVLKEACGPVFKNRLALRFDAVCPHCRGAKKSGTCLTELPEDVFCESCEVTFPAGTQQSIEISLKDLHLSEADANADFCSADVTHKPTIILQKTLGHWTETLNLADGIYLLKRKGILNPLTIIVDSKNSTNEIHLREIWKSDDVLNVGNEIQIHSDFPQSDQILMLEAVDRSRGALLASEVILDPELAKLIPEGALKCDFPLEMGSRALMFTDVVGSTDLYHKIGDTEAFNLVRESFLFIGEIARKHQGILVKTIGDATMYTFPSMRSALSAAIEMQEMNGKNPLKLRASLHFGPCLSVGTKMGMDFFGDTVNICAKFQSEAEAGQIVFEERLRVDLNAETHAKYASQNDRIPFKLKGDSAREFTLSRISTV